MWEVPSEIDWKRGRAAWLAIFALAALLLLFPSPQLSPLHGEEERPADRLAILFTGETHGNVEPCG